MRRLWIRLHLPGWRPVWALSVARKMHVVDLRWMANSPLSEDMAWGARWAARRALYERVALWGAR